MIENSPTIIFLAVLIVSFLFSHFIHLKFASISQFGGIEFVLFGLLTGPHIGFGVVSTQLMASFTPFISLLVGLYGFLLGLEIIQMKSKGRDYRVGFFFFLSIFILISSIFLFASYLILPSEEANSIHLELNLYDNQFALGLSKEIICLSVFLGALASISSSFSIGSIIKSANAESSFINRFSGMAITGEVLMVIIAGISLSALRGISYAENLGMTVVEWSLLSVVLGVSCGLFFWFITTVDRSQQKTYLATIGIVTLTTGVAHLTGFSPILLATICGLIVALTNDRAEAIYEEVNAFRGHISILILFFSGVSVGAMIDETYIQIFIVYIGCRIIALSIVPIFTKHWLQIDLTTSRPGRIFYPHDILVVAFSLDLTTKNFPYSHEILFSCLSGYLFFKLLSIPVVKSQLNEMWESRPRYSADTSPKNRSQDS